MSEAEIKWRPAGSVESLTPNGVHVWRVDVDASRFELEKLAEILSPDELGRSARFHFEKDKKRYILSRAVLRMILGDYLQKKPQDITFEYNAQGKPFIDPMAGGNTLRFNLSHSGAYTIYALTHGNELGIDIEKLRDGLSIDVIARNCFSPQETMALETASTLQKVELFFRYWTRKEAILKAVGKGLALPMSQFDVSSMDGPVSSQNAMSREKVNSSCWYVRDLAPGEGYVAALAVGSSEKEVTFWQYTL